jgi:hypothetical protein
VRSIPYEVINFSFNLSNPSSHAMALGLTQPLIEIRAKILGGGREMEVRMKRGRPPSASRLSGRCGIIDISASHRPPLPVKCYSDSFTLLSTLSFRTRSHFIPLCSTTRYETKSQTIISKVRILHFGLHDTRYFAS